MADRNRTIDLRCSRQGSRHLVPRGSAKRRRPPTLHFVILGAPLSNGGRTMAEPTGVDNDPDVTSRRRFLSECGALIGGAVRAGGLAGHETLAAADAAGVNNLPPNVPEWMKTPGDP